jgi:hypothetical protein
MRGSVGCRDRSLVSHLLGGGSPLVARTALSLALHLDYMAMIDRGGPVAGLRLTFSPGLRFKNHLLLLTVPAGEHPIAFVNVVRQHGAGKSRLQLRADQAPQPRTVAGRTPHMSHNAFAMAVSPKISKPRPPKLPCSDRSFSLARQC